MDDYTFTPEAPLTVREYLARKSLVPSFAFEEIAPEEHAHKFVIAKMTQVDLLRDMRDSLRRAVSDGVPFEQWKADIEPMLRKRGWWGVKEVTDPRTGEIVQARLGSPRRLRTIYNANVRTSYAVGQWERIQANKQLLPYLIYTLGPSEEHRPLHLDKEGLILRADDPFWDEWYFPNGWGCKCGVRQISEREATRRGYTGAPAPDIPTKRYVNPRTGEERRVPAGIDPGWSGNVGRNAIRRTAGQFAERIQAIATPENIGLVRAVLRDQLADDAFQEFLEGRTGLYRGSAVVATTVLPKDLGDRIGSTQRVVMVSADTISRHNPSFKAPGSYPPNVAYSYLPDIFDDSEIYWDGDRTLDVLKNVEGSWYRLVLKVLLERNEIWQSSYYKTTERNRRKIKGKRVK